MITSILLVNGGRYMVNPDGENISMPEYYGLSTDNKPVDDIRNAEIFFEMDTGNVFIFDEENAKWMAL